MAMTKGQQSELGAIADELDTAASWLSGVRAYKLQQLAVRTRAVAGDEGAQQELASRDPESQSS
jgi:hypothetical protein